MRGKFLILAGIFIIFCSPAFAQTIYPLDRTDILAGARFDIKVEFNESSDSSKSYFTLNDKKLEEVLGKPLEYIARDGESGQVSYILRDAVLNAPGTYVLKAVENGQERQASWTVYAADKPQAKNVILFIGDGLSMGHRTAARILKKGVVEGKAAGQLAMDDMPAMALVSTAAADSISTDSANTATAYTTGLKAPVSALGVFADRTKDPFDNPRMETLGSLAKRNGLSVGIVTDAEVTDATPASMYGHTRSRDEAGRLLDQLFDLKPDLVMGGGEQRFKPQSAPGSKRKDDTDVVKKFADAGYAIVRTASELSTVKKDGLLLGLFASGNMDGALDRKFLKVGGVKEFPDQPDLTDKLQAALELLSKNKNGFVLMVEAALIDKYTHALDMDRAVYDTIMLDNGVAMAKDWASKNGNETLIMVVADHGHPVSLVGTINDDMSKDPVSAMRESVSVYEQAGFPNYPPANAEGFPPKVDVSRRIALFSAATPDYYETFRPKMLKPNKPTIEDANGHTYSANPDYKDVPGALLREGILPKTAGAEVHSGDDVVLTAIGPGSERVHGQMDNTHVFRIITEALGLGRQVQTHQ